MRLESTLNNRSTTIEQPPLKGEQPKPPRGLNAFYWYQIFALDSVVVKTQNCLARREVALLLQ